MAGLFVADKPNRHAERDGVATNSAFLRAEGLDEGTKASPSADDAAKARCNQGRRPIERLPYFHYRRRIEGQ